MRPVLIGGCPRSGTTLLGTVLGAHPECCPIPEAQFKVEALAGLPKNARTEEAWRSLEKTLGGHRFHSWQRALERGRRDGFSDGEIYPDLVNRLVAAYMEQAGKPDATVWIDDTPSNKNFFPTLFEFFPEARAIHIVRDGRAVAGSVMRRDWGPNTMLAAAYWWVGHLSHGLAAEASLPPSRITRVRYEDLVHRPEPTLTELCGWLDLEYSPRMMDSRFYTVDSRSATFNPLTTSAPVADRAGAWRRELTPREIEIFEAETRDMLTYLGYAMDYGAHARRAGIVETARMGLVEGWRGAGRAVAYRLRRWRWMRNPSDPAG